MSLNKVMLIGNVAAEPEIRYLDQGVCTAQVRLITSERAYTLANGTQVPEQKESHRVLLWRRLAEVVEKYVRTGDKLYIEGKLRTRSYTDRHGITRYITEIWAENMEMLTPLSQKATPEKPAAPAPAKSSDSDDLPF